MKAIRLHGPGGPDVMRYEDVELDAPGPGELADEALQANVADLFELVGSGAVKIEVNQTYALADAVKAHEDLESRRTTGSTVLLP